MLKLVIVSLALIQFSSAVVQEWAQCGGTGYAGDTACASGTTCSFFSDAFWRCERFDYGFKVGVRQILDCNGKEFLIRGVNSANADWDNHGRFYARKSLKSISTLGANTVRIQWRIGVTGNLVMSDLENAIKEAIRNKMAVIVQLHDATGSSDPSQVTRLAQWFADNIYVFQRYHRFLMINIANEWSPFGTSAQVWHDAYKTAISIIRNKGWKGILIIDAPAYAQDPTAIESHGQSLVNHDKSVHGNGNIVFSIHAYADWKAYGGRYNLDDHVNKLYNTGVTWIFGEFADRHPEHPSCSWVDIDYVKLMTLSRDKRIGYLGWSWAGNGNDCNTSLTPLNLVSGNQDLEYTWLKSSTNDLTEWGKRLFTTPNVGIQATSVKGTFFP